MPVKHEEAFHGAKPGDKGPPIETRVSATGFLVQDDLVLTNRHVIEAIYQDHQAKGHHDHWYIRFTYPEGQDGWSETTKRIKKCFALVDPTGGGALDVGLLSFVRNSGELEECQPVDFGELESIAAGNDIAICGFPDGNELLVNVRLGVYRFGPVVHQGIISAIAPYDEVDQRLITMFLTDLNSAKGMSGSPVFLPSNGRVIGLHYAGSRGTLGCALPIDQKKVGDWISIFNRVINGPQGLHELSILQGGT